MPVSDYTSTGGGLKLKGAKNAGIDKKKKKSKKDKPTLTAKASASATPDPEGKANADGEAGAQYDREKSSNGGVEREPSYGSMKTEAERKAEETKRKRVSCYVACIRAEILRQLLTTT